MHMHTLYMQMHLGNNTSWIHVHIYDCYIHIIYMYMQHIIILRAYHQYLQLALYSSHLHKFQCFNDNGSEWFVVSLCSIWLLPILPFS